MTILPPLFFSIIHLSSRKEQGRSANVPEEAGNHLALATHLQSHPSHPPTCTGSGDPPKTPSQPSSRSVHASFSRARSAVPRYTTKPECPTGELSSFQKSPCFLPARSVAGGSLGGEVRKVERKKTTCHRAELWQPRWRSCCLLETENWSSEGRSSLAKHQPYWALHFLLRFKYVSSTSGSFPFFFFFSFDQLHRFWMPED